MTPRARELRIVYSPVEHAGPLPPVGRPADAAAHLRERLEQEPVEVCLVLLLNTKHCVIALHEVSRGTLDACSVHPRLCSAQHKRGYVAATVMWCSGSIPATPLAALLPNAT